VAGWTALLTGALLGKLDRHGDAYSQYALAEALARDVGDSSLLATVLVKRRGLLYWRNACDPRRALELLDMADAATGPSGPPLLTTVILATRAEDRATIGDETGCLRDLEAAEAALRPSEDHFFGPRSPAELGAYRGTSESLLGRHREAVATFNWVLRERTRLSRHGAPPWRPTGGDPGSNLAVTPAVPTGSANAVGEDAKNSNSQESC
jgi:hypothetical protein